MAEDSKPKWQLPPRNPESDLLLATAKAVHQLCHIVGVKEHHDALGKAIADYEGEPEADGDEQS